MKLPNPNRFGRAITYALLGLLWAFTFYESVVVPPFFGYYTTDENFIADSGIFLWYGNTPRCLDWPASPSLLIFFGLFGLDAAYRIIENIGGISGFADVFTQVDLAAFQYLTDRQDLLLLGRMVQLGLVGIIIFLTVRFVYRSAHPLLAGTGSHVLAILIVSSATIWVNAPVLRPEALSGSIFLLIIVRMIFSRELASRESYLLAILFGIVLAERLLFVFVAPIVLGGVYFLSPRRKWQLTWRALLLTTGVFIILCPFILTDPLVVLKSFFGGILAKMQDKPMPTAFNETFIGDYFNNPVSYGWAALSLLGGWTLIREKKAFYLLMVVNWLLFLFLVLRSPKIYGSHVLPAAVFTLVVAAIGIRFLTAKIPRGGLVAGLLVAVLGASSLAEIYQTQVVSHQRSSVAKAAEWVGTLPGNPRLLVHPDLETYLPKNQVCLQRELAQNGDTLKMVRKLAYLIGGQSSRVQAGTLPYIAYVFAFEDERLYETQYQLLLRYLDRSPARKFDYDVYQDNTVLASHSVQVDEAIADFKMGKYDYLVTERTLDGFEPIKVFSDGMRETLYSYKLSKK